MMKVGNNFIIDVLVTLLIASFTILSSLSSGIFIMMGLLLLIILISMPRCGFHIRKGFCMSYMISVIVYTYTTSLWALVPSDTYEIGGSLINITLCMLILYNTYYHANLNLSLIHI